MKEPIWTPSENYSETSSLFGFQRFVEERYHQKFTDYSALHQWSIERLDDFWEAILVYFSIDYDGTYQDVLQWENREIDFIDQQWFEGISLSYAEHIFRAKKSTDTAIIYADETEEYEEITWDQLRQMVSSIQQFLTHRGIKKGDRVAGILNNTIETVAIFLAVNSIGAIWSCCSPDFGDKSVVERFIQIEPKLLFLELTYQYNGKIFSKRETLDHIKSEIASIDRVITVYGDDWKAIFSDFGAQELTFLRVAFNDPIWILYSSGTTGKPKAITHGTGGILLEHFKALALHQHVLPGDRFLWYSTTGWMMWNYALSSLLCEATLCLYNGAIQHDDHKTFWRFVKRAAVSHLGGGAAYFSSIHDLEIADYKPKVIGSTGSPLSASTFRNLQHKFPEAHIISLSGGTDVCSAFLSGCTSLPVYAGEIQCRTLGSAIVAVNDDGQEVFNEVGELVIKKPMPSMPVCFWGDQHHEKYRESYFLDRKGLWSHGDWISINDHGGIVMHGRSDATLNRGGIRIGTAEMYNVVNKIRGIEDSLVIATDNQDGISQMILFIKLEVGVVGNDLLSLIKNELRKQYSARHVPDLVFEVKDIPYTWSGKKLEIPIKKIFSGYPIEQAVSRDVMRNSACLEEYIQIYQTTH